MKRTRDCISEEKEDPFPFGELIEDMRRLVRTFLDPVARFRLKQVCRLLYEEDVTFTLPECLYLSFEKKTDRGYDAFKKWGLQWMQTFGTPIFRWASNISITTHYSIISKFVDSVLKHGVDLSLQSSCPRKPENPFAVHYEYLSYFNRTWKLVICRCVFCGSKWNDIICVQEPTLDMIWTKHGRFLSEALTLDQEDKMWLDLSPK